ncbi:MAG: HAMP domain-containing histidine kinase [Actinomycetota bacterium]|nr:HAMP domain-containing histidine kinase [Actinomycetota bacterium]
MRLSLRNRLAAVFFAINLVAFGALYMYVAPGLQQRLIDHRLHGLASEAERDAGRIAPAEARSAPLSMVYAEVDAASLRSGDRVTLLRITRSGGALRLELLADSSKLASAAVPLGAAHRAVRSGAPATLTEEVRGQLVAEAAWPVSYGGPPSAVIVFSAPISDIVNTVAEVRHEILVAGAIGLLLALLGGYLLARALSRRVGRLEVAARRIAGGDFEHPIVVDSSDELGQLADTFNQMQRQLAQLDSARKKFIATASHELRTPIFSLGGFVELLEDEDLDPDTRQRFLEQVKQQVERLRKLSVDLLDLSRLESGTLELRPEQVDLGELTRSVSGEFEPTLAQHDSRIELRFTHRTIEALCDPVRVAQIMRILIDNALTHTPPGTRIVVTAARIDGHVRVAIRDDGEGIDPQSLPRIFEPFFTADDAQGSGLGLAIASELAECMSGRLSVSSRPGETLFTLEIPS